MTSDDFGRTTREWLDEGPTRMSDRALEATLEEVHVTPQRRAWWPAKRLPEFPLWARAAAIVVLVLGAVAMGSTLRPAGVAGPIGVPSPTAPATPTASPPPTATMSSIALTYGVQYPYRLHLTVPTTWSARDLEFVISKNGGDAPTGMAIGTWLVSNLYVDGCNWQAGLLDPPVGPTVDDLATAIAAFPDRDTTTPTDVTIDGFSGKELEMTVPDVDFTSCDNAQFRSWVGPDDGIRFHEGPLERSRILILDIDGTRVLTFGRTFPETSAADRAELDAILDSMRIESLAAQSPSTSPSAAPSP